MSIPERIDEPSIAPEGEATESEQVEDDVDLVSFQDDEEPVVVAVQPLRITGDWIDDLQHQVRLSGHPQAFSTKEEEIPIATHSDLMDALFGPSSLETTAERVS